MLVVALRRVGIARFFVGLVMSSPFVTYRRFSLAEDALYYTDLFTEHGIPYEVEDDSPPVDISFSGNILNNAIRIKLRPEDFAAADALLKNTWMNRCPTALTTIT